MSRRRSRSKFRGIWRNTMCAEQEKGSGVSPLPFLRCGILGEKVVEDGLFAVCSERYGIICAIMTTVTKTVRFDAAHILTNHQGLCKNLHGHTYRVDVSVAQTDGVGGDMVIDFKDLKRIATEVICDRFDHAFIYNTESVGECEIAAVVEKHGMRTVAIPFRSTAENLSRLFFDELRAKVSGLVSVCVWETADSRAEYRV